MIKTQNNIQIIDAFFQNYNFIEDSEIGSHLSDFEILQVLGEGGFGFVAKVKSKINLNIYAMKKVDLTKVDPELLKYSQNESLFMKKLIHPNICRLYISFKEDQSIYMIMEFMDNGDLFKFLNANMRLGKQIEEEKLWNIFEQCLRALKYIHSLGLIHRDIKPANLLLNNKGEVKLSDFNVSALLNIGKAKFFTKDEKKEEELVNQMTQVGSGNFQAPEVKALENFDIPYDEKIDVYSMGITFCTLAFYKVELPENPGYYSKELIYIIKEMLKGQNERPDSSKIYNDFIKIYVEKYLHSTGLISCINCFYLYNSLKEHFLQNGDDIGPKCEISFHFNQIIKALHEKNKNENLSISIINSLIQVINLLII